MPRTRKSHPPSLKARVAIEAIKGHKTTAQIAQMFGVHPTQVGGWKKQALTGLPDLFGNGREQIRQQADTEKDGLYRQIGQLKVELDFLIEARGIVLTRSRLQGVQQVLHLLRTQLVDVAIPREVVPGGF